ncbi:MAG: cytochrome b/b6 domain-containing protein [Burkholderiales bacterium]
MDPHALLAERYDTRTIVLHWLTAVLVVGVWVLGQVIDVFPKGVPRVTARSLHITGGTLLGLLLVYRIVWRAGPRSVRLPPADAGWLGKLSTLTHFGLYILLCAAVLAGLANTWVRGDNLFNLVTLPAFDPGNSDLRETVEELHELAANLLLLVAGLHALAALVHHAVFRDDVMRRMGRRPR